MLQPSTLAKCIKRRIGIVPGKTTLRFFVKILSQIVLFYFCMRKKGLKEESGSIIENTDNLLKVDVCSPVFRPVATLPDEKTARVNLFNLNMLSV